MPESMIAAQPALACDLATLSVVCPAAPLCNGGQRQAPAGDRFQMFIRFGEAHKQVPPVVDERDEASHELAAGETAGGKASPAPLVLQLIEGIFAIGAIAVELGGRQNLLVEGSNEHAVFIGKRARPDLNEAERQLTGAGSGDGHALL